MSEKLGNLTFILSLIGKGIILNILTVGSSATENLPPGYFSAENPTLLDLFKLWALLAASSCRRAATGKTSFLGGIPDWGSCQHLVKLPLTAREFPAGSKY